MLDHYRAMVSGGRSIEQCLSDLTRSVADGLGLRTFQETSRAWIESRSVWLDGCDDSHRALCGRRVLSLNTPIGSGVVPEGVNLCLKCLYEKTHIMMIAKSIRARVTETATAGT